MNGAKKVFWQTHSTRPMNEVCDFIWSIYNKSGMWCGGGSALCFHCQINYGWVFFSLWWTRARFGNFFRMCGISDMKTTACSFHCWISARGDTIHIACRQCESSRRKYLVGNAYSAKMYHVYVCGTGTCYNIQAKANYYCIGMSIGTTLHYVQATTTFREQQYNGWTKWN